MGRKSTKRHRASAGADAARAKRLLDVLGPQRRFTRCEAQAALAFIRPVVADLQAAFSEALRCHELLRCAVLRDHIASLELKQAEAIARFDRAIDEIELTGAELVDCETWSVGFSLPDSPAGSERWVWTPGDDLLRHVTRCETGTCAAAEINRSSMSGRCGASN